jgi:hypothetical protein
MLATRATLEEEMVCFGIHCRAQRCSLRNVTFSGHGISGECGPQFYPLASILLKEILQQNAKRKNSFRDTTFTPNQSRMLATSGARTDTALD